MSSASTMPVARASTPRLGVARMRRDGLRSILVGGFIILFLGPPILRTGDPGFALQAGFALPWPYVVHVGVWILGATLCGLLLLHPFASHAFRRLLSLPVRLLLLFGLLAMASTLYSINPPYTAFFAMKYLLAVALPVLIATRVPLYERAEYLLWLIYLASFFGVGLVGFLWALNPVWVGADTAGVGYRLTGGIFADYGGFAAIAGLPLLVRALQTHPTPFRALSWAGYLGSWYVVLSTQTRSTVFGAAVMLLAILVLHPRPAVRRVGLYLLVVGSVVLLTQTPLGGNLGTYILRGQEPRDLIGLSDRDVAFSHAVQEWRESPWIGEGFAAGSVAAFADFPRTSGLGIGAPHDALSKALVDLGLLGAGILLLAVFFVLVEMRRAIRETRGNPDLRLWLAQITALVLWALARSVVSVGIADAFLQATTAIVALHSVRQVAKAVRIPQSRPPNFGLSRQNA
jgi:hypothetical protein